MGRWYLASSCVAGGELVHTTSSHMSPRVPNDRQAQYIEQESQKGAGGDLSQCHA